MYKKTGYKLCEGEEEERAVAAVAATITKINNDKISRPYGLCHHSYIVFVRSIVGWNRISGSNWARTVENAWSHSWTQSRAYSSYTLGNVWWRDKRCWRIIHASTHTHTHIQKISIFANIQNANPPWNLELNLLYLLSLRPLFFFPFRTKNDLLILRNLWTHAPTLFWRKSIAIESMAKINLVKIMMRMGLLKCIPNRQTILCQRWQFFVLSFYRIRTKYCVSFFRQEGVRLTNAKRFHFIRYVSTVFRLGDGDLMILSFKN